MSGTSKTTSERDGLVNPGILRIADHLALALKQSNQAQRNIRQIQIWAKQYGHSHLATGLSALLAQIEQANLELHTLISHLRTRAQPEVQELGLPPRIANTSRKKEGA